MSGNIILIDDHTLFRRGIRSVLDEADTRSSAKRPTD